MRYGLIFSALMMSACAASTPSSAPRPEATPPLLTAPAVPTAAPSPAPSPAATELPLRSTRSVTFTTADGVTLHGTFYGQGATAVILSEMGAQHEDTWSDFANSIAAQGYLAFTYDFRYWVTHTRSEDALRDRAADDLRAAIKFVRAQGPRRVVLVGASLGALATIQVADEEAPAAVIILSAPMRFMPPIPSLEAKPADIEAIQAPKLFVVTEHDHEGFTLDIQQMFDAAHDPKELQLYPGAAHGTELFSTGQAAELTRRLIDFLQRYAPLNAGG